MQKFIMIECDKDEMSPYTGTAIICPVERLAVELNLDMSTDLLVKVYDCANKEGTCISFWIILKNMSIKTLDLKSLGCDLFSRILKSVETKSDEIFTIKIPKIKAIFNDLCRNLGFDEFDLAIVERQLSSL